MKGLAGTSAEPVSGSGNACSPRELRSNLRLELWEVEHGPRGGYELSLIEKGKNYGWPPVFYGEKHNRLPISQPETPLHLAKPVLYWAPVIAPRKLMFHRGPKMFLPWNGNCFIHSPAGKSTRPHPRSPR